MMRKHIHVQVRPIDGSAKQAEAANTARLRALRLTKEAADRDAASLEMAAAPAKSRRRQLNHSTSGAS